jgi:hypothetical protein
MDVPVNLHGPLAGPCAPQELQYITTATPAAGARLQGGLSLSDGMFEVPLTGEGLAHF